ncbi:MAG: flagellar filament capping protein FliD [Desulfovibrionales bacterium]
MAEDLLSGQLHFTGLGSGTDFNEMITKLVETEQVHITRLEKWKTEWEEKIEAFQELNTKTLSLKTTLSGMDTTDEFLQKTATTTDESVLTATAGSAAQEGNYEILVKQLAKNHILTHSAGHEDSSSDITSETDTDSVFVYTYNEQTVSIDVPSETTLSELADRINKDTDNPGVRASIIDDGTKHHLQIRGLDLGAEYDVAIDGATTLTDYGDGSFEESQTAQNSQIRVDGYPSDPDWIERSSNTIDDVIPGLNLSLNSASADPVRVTVDRDTAAITEQVETFVTEVNEVLALLREQSKVDRDMNQGSILTGNYGVQMTQGWIKSILASRGIGFDYNRDTVVNLGSIGITTDADEGSATMGQLQFDKSAFLNALNSDPDGVAALFSADYQAETDSADFVPADDPIIRGVTSAGTFDVSYDVDASGTIINAKINGEDAGVDNSDKIITGKSGAAKGLSLSVRNTEEGAYSGTFYLKQGKIGQLGEKIDQITDGTEGTFHILEDNYHDIIDNIDKKIEYEERRITRMERDMRNRFARLESLLGQYDQLGTYLSSQIDKLKA